MPNYSKIFDPGSNAKNRKYLIEFQYKIISWARKCSSVSSVLEFKEAALIGCEGGDSIFLKCMNLDDFGLCSQN